MNDDLLRLLGLDEKPREVKHKEVKQFHPEEDVYEPYDPPESVLHLDEYDLARGVEIAKKTKLQGLDELAWADFYGAAFKEEPVLHEQCKNKRRLDFLKALIETPEYTILRQDTRLEPIGSKIAATKFAQQYLKLEKEDKKDKQPRNQREAQKQERKKENRCLLLAGEALEEAQEELDDLNNTMRALGCGKGSGQPGESLNIDQVANTFQKVRNSDWLRKIIAEAGRMRPFAQGKQREKSNFGYDDMIGLTISKDVSQILPSELALLDDPDLGLLQTINLCENGLLAREYIGYETVGLGPIVVVCDESGSMDDWYDPKKIIQAKAFCLTMAWVAQWQNRFCVLVGYSGGTQGHFLVMKPNKWPSPDKIMDWLVHFFGGGTEMDVPLQQIPKWWSEWGVPIGRTDMILLTDAICTVPSEMQESFNQWKKQAKAVVKTMIIGCGSAGDLTKISDEVYLTNNITMNENGIVASFKV